VTWHPATAATEGARRVQPGQPGLPCADCGTDCLPRDPMRGSELFVLRDDVWSVTGLQDGALCIGCVEARIGRRLRADDFQVTTVRPWDTERLRDRKRARSPQMSPGSRDGLARSHTGPGGNLAQMCRIDYDRSPANGDRSPRYATDQATVGFPRRSPHLQPEGSRIAGAPISHVGGFDTSYRRGHKRVCRKTRNELAYRHADQCRMVRR
jgi:hypothetical protein